MPVATVMDAALKYLNRRACSQARLRELLLKSGYIESEIDETLQRLIAWGYLNDQELGLARLQVLQAKLKSRVYIEADLIQQQLTKELVAGLLSEYYPEELELTIAQRLIARKAGLASSNPIRALRLLARSGFAETTIEACFPGISPT